MQNCFPEKGGKFFFDVQKQRYHLFCNIIGSIILTQEVVKVLLEDMFENKHNSVDSSRDYIM